MDNKLIKKEDITIFDRIKSFFFKLLKKDRTEVVVKDAEKKSINEKSKFEENLKVNISTINEKENKFNNFIKKIEDNPDLVENFSENRLDKLISYYERITKEKAEKIKRLKESLN